MCCCYGFPLVFVPGVAPSAADFPVSLIPTRRGELSVENLRGAEHRLFPLVRSAALPDAFLPK